MDSSRTDLAYRMKTLKENRNMKSLRIALRLAGLMSLATLGFAQSDAQTSSVAAVPSEAQKPFTTMKSFAREWEGSVTVPEVPQMAAGTMHASRRVASRAHGRVQ